VGPLGAEDFPQPLDVGVDAALAAGALERGRQLRAGQPRGPTRRGGEFEDLVGLGAA
jgi:hypothetical protein